MDAESLGRAELRAPIKPSGAGALKQTGAGHIQAR